MLAMLAQERTQHIPLHMPLRAEWKQLDLVLANCRPLYF